MAQVAKTPTGYAVERLVFAAIPPQTIIDGMLVDEKVFSAIFDRLIAQIASNNHHNVVLCIPGSSAFVKRILFPAPSREEVTKILREDFNMYFPFSSHSEVYFDIAEMGKGPSDHLEVLVVACKKRTIDSYLEVIQDLGINPMAVDVAFFALQNLFETVNGRTDVINMLVDIGYPEVNINVVKHGISLFTQDIFLPESVNPAHFLGEEIERAIVYYDSLAKGLGIECGILSGEMASQALLEHLQERLPVPLRLLETFHHRVLRKKEAFCKATNTELAGKMALCIGAAIGLLEAND